MFRVNYEKIAGSINAAIEKSPDDKSAYGDLFSLCRSWEAEDFAAAHAANKALKAKCAAQLRVSANKAAFYEQWRKCLLFEAPHDFDSYLTYMELNREASKRFYQPRKKQLKPVVDALQALCGDDELDLLAVSLPPGVGKTTLAIFLLTWIAGRDPNHPNLTGSHSNSFVRGVYSDYCNVG